MSTAPLRAPKRVTTPLPLERRIAMERDVQLVAPPMRAVLVHVSLRGAVLRCQEEMALMRPVVFDLDLRGESVRLRGVVTAKCSETSPPDPDRYVIRLLGLGPSARAKLERTVDQLPAFVETIEEWTDFDLDAFAFHQP